MKLTVRFLAAILSLMLVFSLCACGGNSTTTENNDDVSSSETQDSNSDDSSKEEETAGFKVKVIDDKGNPVQGVMVQVCKDTCLPAMTDANGIATFNIEITSEHKLSLMDYPDSLEYTGEAEIYLEDGMTEYTITLNGVA